MTNYSYPGTDAQRQSDDWNPIWDMMEEVDPDYLEAFLAFQAVPQKQGPCRRKPRR